MKFTIWCTCFIFDIFIHTAKSIQNDLKLKVIKEYTNLIVIPISHGMVVPCTLAIYTYGFCILPIQWDTFSNQLGVLIIFTPQNMSKLPTYS